MPKISVVMPVYNTKEEFLREAIESILNQTYSDFEFIIINDGSTNNAEDVILSYKDNRIVYIKQENQGIVGALNNGILAAKGEYIARMDSDDISLPYRFEKQVNFLDSNPQISILGTWFECFPQKRIIKHPEIPKLTDFIKICCIGHPTVMMRLADLKKYNLLYDNRLKCEDYELWSRAIKYLNFYNLQEVLLKYRVHDSNSSKPCDSFHSSEIKVKQKMLDYLTLDKSIQKELSFIIDSDKIRLNFLEKIFSIKNFEIVTTQYKVITICGFHFYIQKNKRKLKKILIVRLMGGLGNQMFQYAFGKALEIKTGRKVLFDKLSYQEAKKLIINNKNEDADGVVIRNYALDIFNINNDDFADLSQIKRCKKRIQEENPFIYNEKLFEEKRPYIYYEGYFQNENYFKDIKEIIKNEFKFPDISEKDEFNQNLLKKINTCENPVFIHLRRGDYVNLGWDLSINYYKKAIEYIKEHVKNPTFFVFGQDCKEFINKEFGNIDTVFEIIGEENSKNNEDWKDIALMLECKHAIIANSSFSWWGVWLGKANDGIVVAPSPFVNGQDEIICDNWVKISI